MTHRRFAFGPFAFDADHGSLARDGVSIAIGARGLALLNVLLAADGEVVTKAVLMDTAWPGLVVEESNLSVQIAALRKLLGPLADGSEWIKTVPRVGYRFARTIGVEEPDSSTPSN